MQAGRAIVSFTQMELLSGAEVCMVEIPVRAGAPRSYVLLPHVALAKSQARACHWAGPWHMWHCAVGREERGCLPSADSANDTAWQGDAVGEERHSRALVREQWAHCGLGPLWMPVLQKLPINSDSFPPSCFILFLSAFLAFQCLDAPLNNAEPGNGASSGYFLFYFVRFFFLVNGWVPAQPFCCVQGCCVGQAPWQSLTPE